MRPILGIFLAAGLLGAAAMGPSQASSYGCHAFGGSQGWQDPGAAVGCAFNCQRGLLLRLAISASYQDVIGGYVRCGGVEAQCLNPRLHTSCVAESDSALSAGRGECFGQALFYNYLYLTCELDSAEGPRPAVGTCPLRAGTLTIYPLALC